MIFIKTLPVMFVHKSVIEPSQTCSNDSNREFGSIRERMVRFGFVNRFPKKVLLEKDVASNVRVSVYYHKIGWR